MALFILRGVGQIGRVTKEGGVYRWNSKLFVLLSGEIYCYLQTCTVIRGLEELRQELVTNRVISDRK